MAFAVAVASSGAVFLPLIRRWKGGELEKFEKLLLVRYLLARRVVRLGTPHGTQDAVAIKLHQVRKEAGAGDFGGVGQREHLDVATPDAEVVAVPLDRSVDELAVHASVRAETDIGSPFLKIEEIAEKTETPGLCRAA